MTKIVAKQLPRMNYFELEQWVKIRYTTTEIRTEIQLNRYQMKHITSLLVLLSLLSLSACSEYWWTRGQPPATKTIYSRAEVKFDSVLEQSQANVPDLTNLALSIRSSLNEITGDSKKTQAKLSLALQKTTNDFIKLDNNISYGSRPAYGELSGQLRSLSKIVKSGETPKSYQLNLFAARSLFFLADELSVSSQLAQLEKKS